MSDTIRFSNVAPVVYELPDGSRYAAVLTFGALRRVMNRLGARSIDEVMRADLDCVLTLIEESSEPKPAREQLEQLGDIRALLDVVNTMVARAFGSAVGE